MITTQLHPNRYDHNLHPVKTSYKYHINHTSQPTHHSHEPRNYPAMCMHIIARNHCGHMGPYLGAVPCPHYAANLSLLSQPCIPPFSTQTIRINTANCATDSGMKYEDVQLATCVLCIRRDLERVFRQNEDDGGASGSGSGSGSERQESRMSEESSDSWKGRLFTDLTEGGQRVMSRGSGSRESRARGSERGGSGTSSSRASGTSYGSWTQRLFTDMTGGGPKGTF